MRVARMENGRLTERPFFIAKRAAKRVSHPLGTRMFHRETR